MTQQAQYLTGQFLIAMPGMEDPRFVRSIVYICSHSKDGAMGLIVNKPQPDVRFTELLEQLGIPQADKKPDIRVQFGGPVEPGRGFVLHSADVDFEEASLKVDNDVAMTASIEVLEAIAMGDGPSASMLALGYTGWGSGQLEAEILRNGWLTAPGSPDLIFNRAHEFKWAAALKSIGIDASTLSSQAGRA